MVPEYAREAMKKTPEVAKLAALVTDADGRTLWVSEAFGRLFGYALEDMAGRRPGHVLHGPDTDPETAAAMARALRAKQAVKTPILNYKKDGTPVWMEVEILPLFDEKSGFAGFISFGHERAVRAEAVLPPRPYRVLVAEDHPINLKLVVALLEAAGCEARSAQNGEEALAALDKSDFDLIIMDSQMPILTGVEAITMIRHRSDWKQRIPIMSLTAHAMRGAEEYHTSAGADIYMSKPIRSDCFIGAVKKLAKQGRDLRVRNAFEAGTPSAS
jgi:PAS domain S-box-containing protein